MARNNKNQFHETKRYLSEISRMTTIIENREVAKAKWEALACNVSAKIKEDIVQTSPRYDKIGDYAVEIVALDKEIDACKEKKEQIIKQIESMPNVNHVIALSMIYIREMNVFDVADSRDRSLRTAQRDITAAHKAFEDLYGESYLKPRKDVIKCH